MRELIIWAKEFAANLGAGLSDDEITAVDREMFIAIEAAIAPYLKRARIRQFKKREIEKRIVLFLIDPAFLDLKRFIDSNPTERWELLRREIPETYDVYAAELAAIVRRVKKLKDDLYVEEEPDLETSAPADLEPVES